MFSAYADRPPDPDGPIDHRTYGIQEYLDLASLIEEIEAVFKITVPEFLKRMVD